VVRKFNMEKKKEIIVGLNKSPTLGKGGGRPGDPPGGPTLRGGDNLWWSLEQFPVGEKQWGLKKGEPRPGTWGRLSKFKKKRGFEEGNQWECVKNGSQETQSATTTGAASFRKDESPWHGKLGKPVSYLGRPNLGGRTGRLDSLYTTGYRVEKSGN